ncbi:uncharacterized protein LOC120439317 isoform X2 [Oreochromis aureus]|uniref:uncharacterized protein LOC120439317 isoform X2 n=1 Tax=Oreochromis aureus TaxID=47969 RepID=UPI0019537B45|nr:uncharacterized protein LOC120439317 isoform X2 [Oreochromis aureus]
MAAQKDQPGDEYTFKWTKEQTADFIKTRGENDHLFTGVKNSATVGWRTVLEKLGLQGKVTPLQAKKKWDNLKKRYKDCKCPGSGPSTAVGDQSEREDETDEEGGQPATTGRKRRRDRGDELLELIKEDMQYQREAEERREQESRDRMERLFSILERLVPK